VIVRRSSAKSRREIKQLRDLFRGRPDFVVNFVAVQLQFLRFIQKFRIGHQGSQVGDADRGRWRLAARPRRGDAFRLDLFPLNGQQFAPHFREGFAKFRHFTAAARRDRVHIVAAGEGPDASDQIVQGGV